MPAIHLWISEHEKNWETCLTAAERPWRWLPETSRMPGCFKKTLFAFGSLISFVSFILLLVAMGTPKWITGKTLCKTGADLVNATDPELVKFIGEIYYGLFQGGKIRQCGLGGRRSKFTSKYSFGWIFSLRYSSTLKTLYSFCLQNLQNADDYYNLYLWLSGGFYGLGSECEHAFRLAFFLSVMFCNSGIKVRKKTIPRARLMVSF